MVDLRYERELEKQGEDNRWDLKKNMSPVSCHYVRKYNILLIFTSEFKRGL